MQRRIKGAIDIMKEGEDPREEGQPLETEPWAFERTRLEA
jgi:hypothetical protein